MQCRFLALEFVRCANHSTRNRGLGKPCHGNYTREHRITNAIAERLDALSTPEAIDAALDAWGDEFALSDLHADIDRAEKAAADVQRKRDRLALAFAAGDMDSHQYRRADDTLQREMEGHLSRAVEAKRLLSAAPDLELRRHTLERLSRGFRFLVANEEPAVVGKLLNDLGVRVWCEDGQVARVGPD